MTNREIDSRITVRYVGVNGLWLDGDSVDVLVQTLQQVSQKLLRVLLTVAHESRRESLDLGLERGGVDDVVAVVLPELLDYLAESLDQGTLHTRRRRVYVGQILLVQQVLQQRPRIAQALYDAVHETLRQKTLTLVITILHQ